jgi:hypothetical protein
MYALNSSFHPSHTQSLKERKLDNIQGVMIKGIGTAQCRMENLKVGSGRKGLRSQLSLTDGLTASIID